MTYSTKDVLMSKMEAVVAGYLERQFDNYTELYATDDDLLDDTEAYGDTYVSKGKELSDSGYERLHGMFKDSIEESIDDVIYDITSSPAFYDAIVADIKHWL